MRLFKLSWCIFLHIALRINLGAGYHGAEAHAGGPQVGELPNKAPGRNYVAQAFRFAEMEMSGVTELLTLRLWIRQKIFHGALLTIVLLEFHGSNRTSAWPWKYRREFNCE